jgi:hypothetical protein
MMDSYGVITIGNYLLSIPGLVLYLVLVAGGIALVGRLVDGVPIRFRLFNLAMYGLSVAAIVGWMFVALGLSFYVAA